MFFSGKETKFLNNELGRTKALNRDKSLKISKYFLVLVIQTSFMVLDHRKYIPSNTFYNP